MKDELYRQALSFFNSGDYEKALNILKQEDTEQYSFKDKQLFEQCKKQLAEQYYYLINESIQQEDYQNARALKNEYKAKFGVSSRIDSIVVPEKSSVTSSQQIEQDDDEEESYGTRFWIIIAGVVVIGLIALFCWKHNRNKETTNTISQENTTSVIAEPETYEEKSEAIISKLKEEYGDKIRIVGKYPELSQYCVAYIENFSSESFHCIVVCNINTQDIRYYKLNDGDTIFEHPIKVWKAENRLLLIMQENNYVEVDERISYTLAQINTTDWKFSEITSGYDIKMGNNKIIVSLYGITSIDEEYKYSYCNIDVYYDLNGNIIKPKLCGDVYKLKGQINDKYGITMYLSVQNDKIYGKYYYDSNGSENVLYLYGGMSSKGIALLEFNDKGEQTSTFRGRFSRDSFSGTFVNYQNKEMPFELYLDGPSSNNEHQATFSMPDRNAEFPGGMVGLGQYITENLQYPADAKTKRISGNVRVSYIIDKDGSIIEAKIIESVDPDLDNEALWLIRSMPKWKPGVRNGKYVKMRTSTVIPFELK